MAEFKVGDKVRFIEGEFVNHHGGPGIAPEMIRLRQKSIDEKQVHTVMTIDNWTRLDFDGQKWFWDDRWLELTEEKPIKKGPIRGANGRFIKKNAAAQPAPAVVKKEEFPETVRDAITAKLAGRRAECCAYGIQYAKETILHAPDICHARLIHRQGLGEMKYAALHMKGHFSGKDDDWKKYFTLFLDHTLNKSSFKHCFITKDVNEAIEKGILLNIDAPQSQVVAAAIYIRSFTEFPATIKMFKRLIDMGIPVGISWIISQGVNERNTHNGFIGGHHVLIGTMPIDVLINGLVNDLPLPVIEEDTPFKSKTDRFKIFRAICGIDLYYVEAKHRQKTLDSFFLEYTDKEAAVGFGVHLNKISDFKLLKLTVALSK